MFIEVTFLITFGLIIILWLINVLIYNSELNIFKNESIIILIWLIFLTGDFFHFWNDNNIVAIVLLDILVLYTLFKIHKFYNRLEKTRIKRIFKIYKQQKIRKPFANERHILKITARIYFQKIGWNKNRIDQQIEFMFKHLIMFDIKDVTSAILSWEEFSYGLSTLKYSSKELTKKCLKTEKTILKVYNLTNNEINNHKENHLFSSKNELDFDNKNVKHDKIGYIAPNASQVKD